MKVTIDLTQLLQDGTITRQEHDRLLELSKGETKSHALSVISVLAVVAVVAGAVGLFPDFFKSVGNALLHTFGARGLNFIAIIVSGAAALVMGSGFLSGVCAFAVLTFVGNAGLFYSHAAYFVAIQEPGLTVVVFSALAWIAYVISQRLDAKHARVAVIFSRSCIFIVNLAFWIGSLWGDTKGGVRASEVDFAVAWALALISLGTWAALKDRRWIVNTAAVFGSIHFYTQWFERLGATPGSLVAAGLAALGIVYGLRRYNRTILKPRIA